MLSINIQWPCPYIKSLIQHRYNQVDSLNCPLQFMKTKYAHKK